MAFTGPLADRMQVRELIESYADAVTRRDAETWASLWDEDARWSMPDLGAGVELRGRDLIASSWIEMMQQYHGPAERPWPFLFVSVIGGIEVAGDRAEVCSYSVETFANGAGRTIHLKGEYRDVVLRKPDGLWRFVERIWRLMPLDDHALMAE